MGILRLLFTLPGFILLIVAVVIIYLIIKRTKQKEKEDFEKRDN